MAHSVKPYPQIARDRISATKQLIAIEKTIMKLEKEWNLLGPEETQALRAAMDGRFKLLAKCLPDLKAIEISGGDGGPIKVEIIRFAPPE